MTDPLVPQTSPVVDQLQVLNAKINDITTQRVTYVAAQVTSTAATSFAADISQPDGTKVNLAGIGASPSFMPPVGSTVTLALSGAQVVLVPSSVADGSLTIGSLSATAPSAPTGLTLTTASRLATDGSTAADITATWTPPTTLVGGGAILGSLSYMVQYRVTGTTNFSHQAATLTTSVLHVVAGVSFDVEVAAVDQLGNIGAFSAVSTLTGGHDTTAPATPSTPTVGNYLGQLKITWDGLLGGSAPPVDFSYLEVHISATTGFTPSTATLVGQLTAAGSVFATATYGTTMFAKFVALDDSGNRSTTSAQASGVTTKVTTPDLSPDAPAAPTVLALATATTLASDGAIHATITASWHAPTLTVGGATLTGTLTYVVQYRVTGTTNFSSQTATALNNVVKVVPGSAYDVQVAAVDQLGNVGAFTAVSTATAGSDSTAPPVPSTPTVSNYLGQLKVTWDGVLTGGVTPLDFAWVEVHVSASTGFTPSTATLVNQLTAAGSVFANTAYGTTMFAKLVAVDRTGNRSAASTQASGATSKVVTGDITPGTITPANLSADAPAAPSGFTVSTTAALQSDGSSTGTITASWTAPTLTVNSHAILGALSYMLQYRPTGRATWSTHAATGLTASFPAASGIGYDVEVAAVDQNSNIGAFTAVSTITSAGDTTAPAVPSTPVVTNYLGQLKITWDGLLAGATAPPTDFDFVEVHASSTTGFTPSSATLVSNLSTGGSAFATAVYTTTMFAKFIAVDRSNNKSAASAQGSGSTAQVVSSDIFNGAVGSAQLASLAVTTAKIALLAVNDAQIGNLSVGKLTAGTMTVDVVMGGRFTTALTGARVEMNSSGFQKFNSSGATIVSITGTDNYLFGEFKTATTGRRIEMGSGGTTGIVNFIAAGGTSSFVQSATESGGSVEDIQLGVNLGGHQWWNRIFVNDNAFMGYHAINHQFSILNPSNTAPNNGAFVVQQYNSSTSFTTGQLVRLIIDKGFTYTDPPSLSVINFAMTTGYSTSDSTQSVRMVAAAGGGCAMTTAFAAVPTARVEFRDAGNTTWYPIYAGAYTVGSSQSGKTNIADLPGDAMATVRAARPRTYQRIPPAGPPPAVAPPFEVGLVAEEAPAVLVNGTGDRAGVDLYALATLTLAAVQQLDTRLAAVEKHGPPGP